jgi:hypothetical protein
VTAAGSDWRGDTLRLAFGATAALPDDATLTFAARGADSRCPLNAACVAAGDAEIVVRATAAGERRLHTDPGAGPNTVTAGGTTLRLIDLSPLPFAGRPAAPDADYAALFVVVRP